MKAILFWAALGTLLALPLAAQNDASSYQGPGVLSSGTGDIGQRSGQQVDLRLWAGVNGVYDTNVQPFTTDAHGNLIRVPNLLGTELNFGAYGSHHWEHADLSLNYSGNYRFYPDNSTYNGTNQAMGLGYSVQYSNHIIFNVRVSGATLLQANGVVADTAAAVGSVPVTQLFDSRASYVDVTGSMTVVQSPRLSYTFGGGGNGSYYESNGLTSSTGYHGMADSNYRLSLTNTIGGVYSYYEQNASGGSFNSRTQSFAGQYYGVFGRVWILNLTAGTTYAQIHQIVAVQLNPILAALFGVPAVALPVSSSNFYPTGTAELKRQFQHASAYVRYGRSVAEGNGFLLTTRNENASGGISYTGIDKWNFGIDGRYQKASNLGQNSGVSTWYGGGGGVTYELWKYTHLSGHFDVGHYNLGVGSLYNRTTERATVGLVFSPGSIPLSLW